MDGVEAGDPAWTLGLLYDALALPANPRPLPISWHSDSLLGVSGFLNRSPMSLQIHRYVGFRTASDIL